MQLLAHGTTLSQLLLAANLLPPAVTEPVMLQNFENSWKGSNSYLK